MNAPQWADGATIERFAALPGLERIEQKPQLNAGGSWTLPEGSVLVQTLSLDRFDDAGKPARKRIETRLLVRQQGEWTGYSYRWNAGQTDAELVGASGIGETFEVPDPVAPGGRREQDWRFPSRTECLRLPLASGRFRPGFTPLQLDRDHDYRWHGRQPAPCARAHRRVPGHAAPQARATSRDWSTPTTRRGRSRPGSNRTCTSIARPATSTREAATPPWSWGSPPPRTP